MSWRDFSEDALDTAPVVSCHNAPQHSPQEWDCGCMTAIYVTDRDSRDGERPFEMRLVVACGTSTCEVIPTIAKTQGEGSDV
jgi:hypothetical protein